MPRLPKFSDNLLTAVLIGSEKQRGRIKEQIRIGPPIVGCVG